MSKKKVNVRSALIGKSYRLVNSFHKYNQSYLGKLMIKKEDGAGGSGHQEPYYVLVFSEFQEEEIALDWDEQLEEVS